MTTPPLTEEEIEGIREYVKREVYGMNAISIKMDTISRNLLRLLDAYSQSESRLKAAREALKDLVERLDLVHADSKFQGVWTMAMIHGMNYTGPTYELELNKARLILSGPGAKGEETK